MDHPNPTKEIITVAEMSRMCGLSRSRFYGLIKEQIMPEPSRNPETKRPFYSREQQEQCMLVRRTNCGINGKPILFYAQRWDRQTTVASSRTRTNRVARRTGQSRRQAQTDPVIDELRHGLEQLGMAEVPETKVRTALADAYPDGHENLATATLLMTVFRSLNRQDTPDNVAR